MRASPRLSRVERELTAKPGQEPPWVPSPAPTYLAKRTKLQSHVSCCSLPEPQGGGNGAVAAPSGPLRGKCVHSSGDGFPSGAQIKVTEMGSWDFGMKSNEQRRKSEKAQRQAGRLILQTREGRADEREADAARAALALQGFSNRKTAGPRNAALRRKKSLRTEMQTEKCFRSQLSEAAGGPTSRRGAGVRGRVLCHESREQGAKSQPGSAGVARWGSRGRPGLWGHDRVPAPRDPRARRGTQGPALPAARPGWPRGE